MDKESLEKHIFELEDRLLQPEVRSSAEKIAELLHIDFFEYCSSGSVYCYRKGDVFDEKNGSATVHREIKDFEINLLSPDVVLATYKVIQHDELSQNLKYSLRSSIWKCFNGEWQIVFHQGTLTDSFHEKPEGIP